jgi:trehalose 6-phosphate synthase
VNTKNGALALSTEAGAFDELSGPAIGLNPFDVSETAAALALGLEMPTEERIARALELNRISTKRRPADWLADQLAAAANSSSRTRAF